MLKAMVSGSGKMGRAILDALDADPSIEPVGCIDSLVAPGAVALVSGAEVPLFDDAPRAFADVTADVVIDFTNAIWTPTLVDAALAAGVRPVIGTSGLPVAFVDDLARRCAELRLGGIVAANFAIGGVLMMHMAAIAARFFESAEVIEMHHDQKVDAPSGTSIDTARRMIAAREGKPFTRNVPISTPIEGARAAAVDGVTIHSVRLPGLVAHQEVIFGGVGQTLTIRHDSNGRDSFMPGIILAARAVMDRETLARGLDEIIGLA
jgi:4-hydroxy-tetrahydrodipicolinate reductase